ncbi:unnamed protein product [Dracunculus medinensis]|uniref:ShKT domain-containing protein n=1 Tax=Dracunculus medinensis TaxID=318479 RepID=A0A0N4URT2_DRAME|nr:unnamed protein product [Dracunculus medinensis]
MNMLIVIASLASLCSFANGATETINVCNVPMPTGMPAGAIVQRPSVPVDNCQDRDALACFELFKPEDAADALGRIINENPTTLSSPTQNCKDERQGCAAIRASNSCGGVFRTTMMQQCARTCGYCT